MKLWLDDVRPMPYYYDIHVKTAKHAIDLISRGIITEVSLDNDLGTVDNTGEYPGEGRHVADYIEYGAYIGTLRKMVWEVHTDNTVAKEAITQALTNANKYWKKDQ